MKRFIFGLGGIGAFTILLVYFHAAKVPAVIPVEDASASHLQSGDSENALKPPGGTREPAPRLAITSEPELKVITPRTTESPSPATPKAPAIALNQMLESLVSSNRPFEQKQASWRQLRKAGKIDQAINELEQRLAGGVEKSADAVAALGQAYWQKCASIEDIREQAILVMKADQTFDAALNLDPSNWEARYTKALAMSYWPSELKKGTEVIAQFVNLIEQQEGQPARAEFERPYLRLGEEYEKAGRNDYALQVWQRGAAWFPESQELKKKLASKP